MRCLPLTTLLLCVLAGAAYACGETSVDPTPDAAVAPPVDGGSATPDGSVPDASDASPLGPLAFKEVARFEGARMVLGNRSSDLVLGSDVDGDGVPDLLYGNPDIPDSPEDAGPSAPTQGAVVILSGKDLKELRRIRRNDYATRGIFGYSIASLGDLDGDGKQDIAVGQVGTITPDDSAYEFSGRLFLMKSNGAGFTEQVLKGEDPFHFFGYELLYLGGPNNILVTTGARFWGGRAYGINAKTGATLWTSATSTLHRDLANERRGYRMFDIGDLDGDGTGDVGLSANGQAPPPSLPKPPNAEDLDLSKWPGRQYFYSGATGASLGILQGKIGDNLGFWGSPIGDVDGDGVKDYIACGGATGFAGRCHVIRGTLLRSAKAKTEVLDLEKEGASIIRTHEGVVGADRFDLLGYRTMELPDLDADGVSDYMITAPFFTTGTADAGIPPGGDAAVTAYARGGMLRVVSGKTGATLQELYGGKTTEYREALFGTAAFEPKTKTLYAASQQGGREIVVAYRAEVK